MICIQQNVANIHIHLYMGVMRTQDIKKKYIYKYFFLLKKTIAI